MHELREAFGANVDRWDSFYTKPITGRSFEWIARERAALNYLHANVATGSRILEVGCGAAHAALSLAEKGYQMICVDFSHPMIERAKENFARASRTAEFIVSSTDSLSLPSGSVAAVFALGVMDYIRELAPTLERLRELLVDGGRYAFSFGNNNSLSKRIEIPLHRLAARIHILEPWHKISRQDLSQFRSMKEIRSALEAAGLPVDEFRFVGCGMRVGNMWCPPRRMVQQLDEQAPHASWGWPEILGRTIIVYGHTSSP